MKQTTLCYIDDGERYLMLHRVKKDHDASHGKWIGVGGKCEADESPDECMLREVKEETGLTVTRWQYRGIVTFISDTWPNEYMHLFTADRWEGTVDTDCDEGDLAWIAKKDLPLGNGIGDPSLTLWEGDKIFLRLLLDAEAPFFSLKLVYEQDDMVSARLNGEAIAAQQPGTQASCLRLPGTQASSLRGNDDTVADDRISGNRRLEACVPDEACVPKNHCRKYLPHFEVKKVQFITFRLYDSLPKELIESYKILTENWKGFSIKDKVLLIRQKNLISTINKYEDAGYGSCLLKDSRAAAIMRDALFFHNGNKYNLLAWCIMPNHVHVMIQVIGNHSLSEILHSWKSFTSNKINETLNRKGPLWMHEYYDRYIRNEQHYHTTLNYILENPAKAGLTPWPWVGDMQSENSRGQDVRVPNDRGQDARVPEYRRLEACVPDK